MKEIKSLDEIIESIKDEICQDVKGFVFDVDVAAVLEITPANLAVRKTRGSIPLFEICIFCEKRNMNINKLLFG